jgi:hypothetical protein
LQWLIMGIARRYLCCSEMGGKGATRAAHFDF